MTIPFIDLKSQYRRLQSEINTRIQGVLDHGAYVMGPEVADLESRLADYCNVRHAITCSSGTDALLLGLMAHDVRPGDAIFTSPFTFFATAEAIALLGATPVFVDIDPSTFNMDPDRLSEAVGRIKSQNGLSAKGIMPVGLFGLPPDFGAIDEIARDHGLFTLEDAAQSFGGEYGGRISGSLGDIGATSFFPAKPLGCYGDGGAAFTDDDELANRMKSIRIHGMGSDKYDNVRIGLNARMDTIQAAVLIAKLGIFQEEVRMRQRVAQRYAEALEGLVETPSVPEGYQSVWAQYSILSDHRDNLQASLKEQGIPCAVYYRIPCHLSEAFRHLGYREGDMPVSEAAAKRIFSLPMHPYIEDALIDRIAGIIRSSLCKT